MTGTVLLTCGTGRTSSCIAKRLQERNISVLLTSRKGQDGVPEGFKGVTFDWHDEATYVNPFNADANIDTVYIILPPPSPKPAVPSVKRFIDLAREKGVNRFLLITASDIWKGGKTSPDIAAYFDSIGLKDGPPQGQVQVYLDSIGVDYAVLRPSWFFANFIRNPCIKDRDQIISCAGDGKIGFVSEDDIADAAVQLLTASKLGSADPIIVGPELLSYDDIAEIFSEVLGRKIVHVKLGIEERTNVLASSCMPPQLANLLPRLEAGAANGTEERHYKSEETKYVGKVKFRDFVVANKTVWL